MRKMKEILRTIAAAAAALILFFLLYWEVLIPPVPAAALAVALYFGMYFLLKPRNRIGRVDADKVKGGEDSLKLMEQASQDIRSIKRMIPQMPSEAAAHSAEELTVTGQKIFDYLTEHPELISGAHRFADYYLDTAERMVKKYVELQHGGNGGSSSGELEAQTEEALQLLNQAFDKQYNRLLEGDRMEIETEITVLKEMLQREGDA